MKLFTITFAAMALCATVATAQPAKQQEAVKFNPHWYMQIQGGAGYTLGEAKFGKLISPAAALSAGYQFSPVWGLRFGASGWQSKGAQVAPREAHYQFKYLQGNVEATLDLANLFGKFNAFRTVNPYLFAGVGLNGAFQNGEAAALDKSGAAMGHLWTGHKVFVAGRLGLGVDFRASDRVSIGVELNTNMLSDKYNSKKAGNIDWQFNALAGLKIRFGKNYKKLPVTAPAAPVQQPTQPAETPAQKPAQTQPEAVATAPVAEKAAPATENIFFTIRSVKPSENELQKADRLIEYLQANPESKIQITGYADAGTGSHEINQRIAQRRADNVAALLQERGIAAERIAVDSKGDTEQLFSNNDDNRVAICIAQ